MHGLPEGKRKIFNRDKLIQQVLLGGIIIACVVYSWIMDITLLKVLSVVAVAIVGVIIITYYTIEFMTGAGYSVASAINEFIYLVMGLPILLIAAGFLPASILVTMFGVDTQIVVIIIYAVLGVLEFSAISYMVVRFLRERKMSLFQYIKYLFDFDRRREEHRRVVERNEQIDGFYSDLHKVEDRIAKKLQEKSTGFEEFDWKERVSQMSLKNSQKIKCWNCSNVNDEDAIFCTRCSAPLKKE
ncbi:zinc ribbon domain-containing protein [Candidatus Heimdallarchaeota archaeon]|nr:MAG: zinc ribbon domain-containing protein [Candidatus Heimdallarchaeota archaeon]